MIIEENIKSAIVSAIEQLHNISLSIESILLQPTKPEFEGNFTFVTFPLAKNIKKSPEETGNVIGEYLINNVKIISKYNVVKGFLNISISDKFWIQTLTNIAKDIDFGQFSSNNKKVIVEYSSPNTNKPLHLGHLRNNFLGYSVAAILKANGYQVSKVNLVNDRGIHICKSMIAYQLFGNNETPGSTNLKGDHLVGKYYVLFDSLYKKEISELILQGQSEDEAKKNAPIIQKAQHLLLQWEEGNEEVYALWKKMNSWVYSGFEKTYTAIGVDFDHTYYESDTYLLGKEVVADGLEKGIFYKKPDGSVWVDLTADSLDEKLLLRGDGTSVYITQDLGTADLKFNQFGADQSIYVVGNEQDYHFKVLQLVLKKLDRPYWQGIFHLSYGMVDLPSGKMKSREGTVVDADDLIQEIILAAETKTKALGKTDEFPEDEAKDLYNKLGLGALKYFLLKVDPKKRMLFNPEESVELEGNTGPFIQYTYARISAIVRKATQLQMDLENLDFNSLQELQETERSLIFLLYNYPAIINEAAKNYSPSIIAQFAYDLAKTYNRFYNEVSIFQANDDVLIKFRVALSKVTSEIIKKSMSLLGIKVPERM